MARSTRSLKNLQKIEEGHLGGKFLRTSEDTPFLFSDGVTAFGAVNGTIHVVLEAVELAVDNQQIVSYTKRKVAHLRLTPNAAASLQDALEKSLLIITPFNDRNKN